MRPMNREEHIVAVADHAAHPGMIDGHITALSRHETEIEGLKRSDREQWPAIHASKNKVPMWFSLLFTGLGIFSGAVGAIAWEAKGTEMKALTAMQGLEVRLSAVERSTSRIEDALLRAQ